MTPSEAIEKLRLMHAKSGDDLIGNPDKPSLFFCAGCERMHTRCACADYAWLALPALIEVAEAATEAVHAHDRSMEKLSPHLAIKMRQVVEALAALAKAAEVEP